MGYRPIGVERGTSVMNMVVQVEVGGIGGVSLRPCSKPLCKDDAIVSGVPTEHRVHDVVIPSTTSIHDTTTVVLGNGLL
jgi:hypothetical protein